MLSLNATTYYLDATLGNDLATGVSPSQAWKSLEKLNSISLKAGDKVLLKKGEVFLGELHINGVGTKNNPIIIDQYGDTDTNATIKGFDHSLFAVCIFNSEYVELKSLEVVNTGLKRIPFRTGVKIHIKDFGIAHSIKLKNLFIHDVNGSLVKNEGGGSGILIVNEGKEIPSAFDGLLIEDCIIRRCERNGMIWQSSYSSRTNWFPNRNVIIRRNLIDEVPGDGIVPIGCVNTLIEYTRMKNSPDILPNSEAAAGIWPWSCDSTLIQFNEVSDHKAPWDAQGFDSDDNCRYTTFQYNYSHDNYGGFMLVCHDGNDNKSTNIGTIGTIVKQNISINDGIRPYPTHRADYFSPSIHISGPVKDTYFVNNIIYINSKASEKIDRRILVSDNYGGFADQTTFKENIFYTAEHSTFDIGDSTQDMFEGNFYLGTFYNIPDDKNYKKELPGYQNYNKNDPFDFTFFDSLLTTYKIASNTEEIQIVNKKAIERHFNSILER